MPSLCRAASGGRQPRAFAAVRTPYAVASGDVRSHARPRRRAGSRSGDRRSRRPAASPTGSIVRRNLLTLFNLVLAACAVALIATGQLADLLFAGVLVVNSGIGIVQEVRAKRALDRLALLAAPRARVLRDGSRAR